MKKIAVLNHLKPFLELEKTVLGRSDIIVHAAGTNEELLRIHRAEKVNLIITEFDLPGMNGDTLCAELRKDATLNKAWVILICNKTPSDTERVATCAPNQCITRPFQSRQLVEKAVQLLDIKERKSYRVLLQVTVSGNLRDTMFLCNSQDLSATGILIETNKHLEKGDRITCSFFLPHAQMIVTEGEVVRSVIKPDGTFQYGVRFMSISAKQKKSIEAFIEKNK